MTISPSGQQGRTDAALAPGPSGQAASLRHRLAAGDIALGANIRLVRSPEIAPILASCGFHWLMLDFEHAPLSPHIAGDIALAAIRAGLTPVARSRSHDPAELGSLLTMGALAILAPHVDTPAQARAVAAACRFPPRGILGVPGAMPHFGYGLSLKEACDRFDGEVTVIAMIESREALDNAPAIAATPGIDALFIGASDLLWEAGHPGAYGGPFLAEAVARTAAAARASGKACGMGGPRDPALWPGFLGAGMRMILTENDLSLLIRGARDRAAFFDTARPAASM